MISSDIVDALTPVIEAFEALAVAYLVGGSVATSTYGVPRATLDVDIVAAMTMDTVDPFVASLESNYYVDGAMVRDAIQRRASFNVIHLETMVKVDVFMLKERAFDNEAFRRRRRDTLEEGEAARLFDLASPEDMVLHKLEWYRKGGEVSERQWRDVLGVLKVQSNELDLLHLERWAKELGIEDLLQQALTASGGAFKDQE